MNGKKQTLSLAVAVAALAIAGCGNEPPPKTETAAKVMPNLSSLRDGTYTAKSSEHTLLGHSQITLTIKDGQITDVLFEGYTKTGQLKEADYGGDKESALQKKAQIAVKAMKSYAEQLQETQSLDEVDAVTGATVSYEQFMESAQIALKEAQ